MFPETFDLSGEALFCEDVLSRLGADHQDAANSVRRLVIIDRAIAVGPINIFAAAVASDGDQMIFVPSRSAA